MLLPRPRAVLSIVIAVLLAGPVATEERRPISEMDIEGEADYRTPPADGGEQRFRALKYLKRPVVMVRFPGESHELSRSGQPWHRVERLQHWSAGSSGIWLQGTVMTASEA